MKHSSKIRSSMLGAALLVGLASFGTVRTAHASSEFPAALQKALTNHFKGQAFCVPLCTACHNTTKGGPQDLNLFGTNLKLNGGLPLGNTNAETKVDTAITTYFSRMPPAGSQVAADGKWDSDGDGVSDEAELSVYSSPSLAKPRGEQEFCSDLKFGCGANIAPSPPALDRVGLFSAAGVALAGLAVFRRRKRRGRRQPPR